MKFRVFHFAILSRPPESPIRLMKTAVVFGTFSFQYFHSVSSCLANYGDSHIQYYKDLSLTADSHLITLITTAIMILLNVSCYFLCYLILSSIVKVKINSIYRIYFAFGLFLQHFDFLSGKVAIYTYKWNFCVLAKWFN